VEVNFETRFGLLDPILVFQLKLVLRKTPFYFADGTFFPALSKGTPDSKETRAEEGEGRDTTRPTL